MCLLLTKARLWGSKDRRSLRRETHQFQRMLQVGAKLCSLVPPEERVKRAADPPARVGISLDIFAVLLAALVPLLLEPSAEQLGSRHRCPQVRVLSEPRLFMYQRRSLRFRLCFNTLAERCITIQDSFYHSICCLLSFPKYLHEKVR